MKAIVKINHFYQFIFYFQFVFQFVGFILAPCSIGVVLLFSIYL